MHDCVVLFPFALCFGQELRFNSFLIIQNCENKIHRFHDIAPTSKLHTCIPVYHILIKTNFIHRVKAVGGQQSFDMDKESFQSQTESQAESDNSVNHRTLLKVSALDNSYGRILTC